VIAAGQYLATLPYVDPARIYLAGHSVGGTLALLASEMPSPYAAIAAYSGAPSLDHSHV
jgi:dipeptidyl aminopeptidase/acylaminoacyl peptidase